MALMMVAVIDYRPHKLFLWNCFSILFNTLLSLLCSGTHRAVFLLPFTPLQLQLLTAWLATHPSACCHLAPQD
jgi:hypothetical protein